MAQIAPEQVAGAILRAVLENRFEVWVPGSQGSAVRLAGLLPRRVREAALLGMGIARLSEGTDPGAREEYHRRAFPQA
jgi:hypothetical protein